MDQSRRMTERDSFSVIAIIAAHNEADIIDAVVQHLIRQGVLVYYMDDGSTDATLEIVEQWRGRGVIGIERLEQTIDGWSPHVFAWERILQRKAAVASEMCGDWFIHHDADEFAESPWPNLTLKHAIRRVDELGFNAIDSIRLDFWPADPDLPAGADVRDVYQFYAPPEAYNRLQVRCWKKTGMAIDLASSGGHEI